MFPNRFSMKICYIVNLIIRIYICNINIDSILYKFHQNLNCLRELYLVNYCEPIDIETDLRDPTVSRNTGAELIFFERNTGAELRTCS